MKDLNYIFKTPNFDSKIKFYFSLFFMSISDFTILIEKYGDDINIFDYDEHNGITEQNNLKLINIFGNLNLNNKKIDLNDKTIMRLFTKEEIINYYDTYSIINNNFNDNDPVELEKFYAYMLLEKVKEKKELEYGTIYELFDTFSDEEIINAVSNLDFDDKKTFIDLFGLKGDLKFEINSNDHIKNDILIKLYRYMLLKRDEADIPSIIRNIKEQNAYEYTFYDYIRSLCGDKDLTNEFIFEMLSKMDYNSKQCIKDVFGKKLDKKNNPPEDKQFKKVVDTLTVIVKINKDYRKRKEAEYNNSNRKKAGFEEKEKKKEKKETKESKTDKKEEKIKKEDPKKEQEKPEEKTKEENKKNKKEKKEELNTNKKSRLKKFLEENGLDKKDFEKAVELLNPVSKRVVELYYGVKTEPIELEEISEKIGKPLEDILDILSDAEDKIVDLIKTGKINKEKKEKPEKEKEENKKNIIASNKLKEFVSSNKVKAGVLASAMLTLDPIEKIIVDAVLNSKNNFFKEVAQDLNIKEEKAKVIYENASSKIISLLGIEKDEDKQEEKIEKKEKEETKEENKGKKRKSIKDKTSSLDEFLKESGLTKTEFYNAFSKLDGFSKSVLSAYLGMYSAPVSLNEIAKKYGRSIKEIENIISSAKDSIIKESKSINKINLNNFLKKNGMSMDGFKEELKNISLLNRNLLKEYFGIGVQALSMEILSKKYGKNPKEINNLVTSALNEIKEKRSNKKDNGLSDKLSKFLTVNNIIKEQFINVLELISPEDKMLVSMYFGLNGKEMSIAEIAIVTKTNPVVVKNNLKDVLRQINTLAKSNNLDKNIMNQRYQNIKLKIARISNALIQEASFMTFANSNPMISGILSVIGNMNLSLDDAAKILGMSNDMLMSELMSLDMMCNNFANSISNKTNNGFQDEENVKNKEVGRRY